MRLSWPRSLASHARCCHFYWFKCRVPTSFPQPAATIQAGDTCHTLCWQIRGQAVALRLGSAERQSDFMRLCCWGNRFSAGNSFTLNKGATHLLLLGSGSWPDAQLMMIMTAADYPTLRRQYPSLPWHSSVKTRKIQRVWLPTHAGPWRRTKIGARTRRGRTKNRAQEHARRPRICYLPRLLLASAVPPENIDNIRSIRLVFQTIESLEVEPVLRCAMAGWQHPMVRSHRMAGS